ncbi:non-homologous end-joining DNA ligase [Arsenicicoccus piscis]|uniref:non-homologous end-joining DNA ligase n=1 Tax=Arsenicicoccus piscis TaxID=673954 RepID=UPI001F4CDE55|nr:non-homologous end-joining DNA ligase [Arsenicicoccus piscis]MCH8626476.1 non-homologous end-joining DNA ligase [Arsenicicoccus piscis]
MPDPRHPVTVEVDGRTLRLTSLDKVLYPATGTTKAEVITYLTQVSGPLLHQLHDRPLTRLRWPHGVSGESFFEKNVPKGAPGWIRTVTVDSPGSTRGHERVVYPLVDDVAGLTWLGQVGALELHTPQWTVDLSADSPSEVSRGADRMVIDLDPGPGAGLHACAQVALLVRERLSAVGLTTLRPVTSGSKGLQLYAELPDRWPSDQVREAARLLAEGLASEHADLVVSSMAKVLRPGKVLLDWSQNVAAKTTITPYSLRGKQPAPFVAAPRTWAEVERGADGERFEQLGPADVVRRLDELGDLMVG